MGARVRDINNYCRTGSAFQLDRFGSDLDLSICENAFGWWPRWTTCGYIGGPISLVEFHLQSRFANAGQSKPNAFLNLEPSRATYPPAKALGANMRNCWSPRHLHPVRRERAVPSSSFSEARCNEPNPAQLAAAASLQPRMVL